jgi:hypothetical protein
MHEHTTAKGRLSWWQTRRSHPLVSCQRLIRRLYARGLSAITVILALQLSVLVGATPAQGEPVDGGRPQTFDETLATVGREVPAFAGLAFDENGRLAVRMAGPHLDVWHAQRVLAKVLDNPTLAQLDAVAVPVSYTFLELQRWYDQMTLNVLAIDGVIMTDIDEAANRIRVGVAEPWHATTVRAKLAQLGTPDQAVVVDVLEPVKFENLRDFHRPVVGGLEIESTRFICTLGFNAIRAGRAGIVTNSHCSNTQGQVEGTIFGQPDARFLLAQETADPPLFVGNGCPAGRRCRHSDAAFFEIPPGVTPGPTGLIAAPAATGTHEWNGTSTFRINQDGNTYVVGQPIEKVGRTTGRTEGAISRTCTNFNVANTDITMLCQWQGNYGSAGGDSGGPVMFDSPNATRPLIGIHWGSGGVFSPTRGGINAELGNMTTCAPEFGC